MELSKRAISVLCAAVELYIRNGEPVASRHVARHSGLGLSPPTVRNVMAELVEAGYLSRPHASAGSLPSDRGFRLFVDSMPRRSAPPPAVRRELAGRMVSMRRELVEDIEWVAQLVAETTREAGVAVRPMGDGPVLEAVSLVLLESRRVLGVVITDDGSVEKRVLDLDRNRTREQLQAISNYLTRTLSGISIQDIEARVSELGNSADLDAMQVEAYKVARNLFARDQNDVEIQVAGTEYLLATPDFSEIERVRSLLSALQDRACIASEFRRVFAGGKTQVLIGEESQATASGGLGIVATLYFRDARRAGAVGVVGSRRMDYQRIVPVVEYIGDTLTQMLETTGASHA
jgi:heat-inducible transcriptional repressor